MGGGRSEAGVGGVMRGRSEAWEVGGVRRGRSDAWEE